MESPQTSDVHAIKRQQNDAKKSSEKFKCKRCGKTHKPRSCPVFDKTCEKCNKKNHFASQCASKSESGMGQNEN